MPPPIHRLTVTPEQVSTLVRFMERHGDLSINPKEIKKKHLWDELVGILNQIGVGPRKSSDQWKKSWTDLKYRTKEKALKIQEASRAGNGNATELTKLEKRVCEVIQKKQSHFELDVDSNDESQRIEDHQDSQENDETADPVFIEFLEQTESLSPIQKLENSSSPSPPPVIEIRKKRKRRDSPETKNESYKRPSTSFNDGMKYTVKGEDENQTLGHHQLLELKRLELETLRETNHHEREKVRAQIDREKIQVQQQLIAFLEEIKPSLIKFLNK